MSGSRIRFHTQNAERVIVFDFSLRAKKKAPTGASLVLTALLFYLTAISSNFFALLLY